MRKCQSGFTLIEILIAVTIMVVAGAAAGLAIYQVMRGTESNSNQLNVVQQVQNTGYWIGHDIQMAVSVNATGNVTFPCFLQCSWTAWDEEGTAVYHQIEYTLDQESGDLYSLNRNHSSSEGADNDMLVAQHIFYQPGSENTTSAVYSNPTLILTVTSIFEGQQETREYRIKKRTGL